MDVDPAAKVEELAGHVVHVLAPAVIEYFPAGHDTHVLAFVAPATPENEPAGQLTHALALVAPVRFEYDPAEQFVQLALPELFLNFPVAHAMHEES
jgi:hypothetical protein